MSSPSIFVLGVVSIMNNWFARWLCSNLGVEQYLWAAGMVPALVVYNMCDKKRLKSAASSLFPLSADLTTFFYVLALSSIAIISVYFIFVPWIILAMAGCTYVLFKAFSTEKTMYMGDCWGAIAKGIFRKVAMNFICERAWMKMKGEWNFCSPYSRNLEVIPIDHYYTLEKPDAGSRIRLTTSCEAQEEFNLDFEIVECEIFCKFEYIPEYGIGTERKDQPNKIEVSLLYKKEPLVEYTYYNVVPERVERFRRLLEILESEGNVVLSNFHRRMDSEVKLAHARCYEFEELVMMVLREGRTIKKVKLGAAYACSISGSSFPSGTATGLLLGLVCCLICSFWKLGSVTSASVFAMAILIFAPMEMDILKLLTKLQRGVQSFISPVLSYLPWKIFRAGFPGILDTASYSE